MYDNSNKRILNKYPGVKIHSITDIHETLDEKITSKVSCLSPAM